MKRQFDFIRFEFAYKNGEEGITIFARNEIIREILHNLALVLHNLALLSSSKDNYQSVWSGELESTYISLRFKGTETTVKIPISNLVSVIEWFK